MAWRVRFAPRDRRLQPGRGARPRIVAYKEFAALDPDRAQPTGLFPPAERRARGQRLRRLHHAPHRRVGTAGCTATTPGAPRRACGPRGCSRARASRRRRASRGSWATSSTSARRDAAGTLLVGAGTGCHAAAEAEPSPARGTLAREHALHGALGRAGVRDGHARLGVRRSRRCRRPRPTCPLRRIRGWWR